MNKKVSRRGKLENGSTANRGLLLDAYTENTSQQKVRNKLEMSININIRSLGMLLFLVELIS